jgi:hypothetical protein
MSLIASLTFTSPSRRLRGARRIEAIGGLRDPRVEQVRVAAEGDHRARVAGDGLDELHVGARRDEARDTRVAEVVEPVADSGEARAFESRAPHAPVEVRLVERRPAQRREDELLRRVAAQLESTRCSLRERGPRRGEERDRAQPRVRLRPLELAPGEGALDADQAALAVDVAPAEGAELAEAKSGPERDVEVARCDLLSLARKEVRAPIVPDRSDGEIAPITSRRQREVDPVAPKQSLIGNALDLDLDALYVIGGYPVETRATAWRREDRQSQSGRRVDAATCASTVYLEADVAAPCREHRQGVFLRSDGREDISGLRYQRCAWTLFPRLNVPALDSVCQVLSMLWQDGTRPLRITQECDRRRRRSRSRHRRSDGDPCSEECQQGDQETPRSSAETICCPGVTHRFHRILAYGRLVLQRM